MASPPGGEVASHRACAHCRSQKVRCLPDDSNPDVCQRCARSGRPCVFTPLQKRKQRKRTDTRVAELEREMRAMRAALRNKQEGANPTSPKQVPAAQGTESWYHAPAPDASRPGQQVFGEQSQAGGMLREAAAQQAEQPRREARQLYPDEFEDRPTPQCNDVVDRGLLSMATARQLFETYKRDLIPHYPIVPMSSTTTADELRRSKPALFLAVIAAAAGKDNSELSALLDKEVLQTYATRSLIQSEKSLELVQALLISSIWYHPPSKFGQLKYYEYMSMATTMAMDIGIGSQPLQHRSRLGNAARGREPAKQAMIHPAEDPSNPDLSMTPRSRDPSPDSGSLESRRTFLACYLICAGVSLSLRRPNILRANSYIRECVEYIKRSPDALPTDRTLTAWAELVMIGEEICTSFAFDDPGGIASITELRTQLMIKDFKQRLNAWHAATESEGSLMIMYWTVRLYLHEVALHVDHSPQDFKAPYQMGVVHTSEGMEIPSQVLAEAIAECVTCSHGLLNTFLAMDTDSLRALPVFSYVRVSFAAFVLAKLCLSAVHPGSRIGKVIDRSTLNVEPIMDKTILHVRNVVGNHRCRVPAIFMALLFKLRQWCLNPAMIDCGDTGRSVMINAAEDQEQEVRQTVTPAPPHFNMAIEGPRVVEQSGSESNQTPETLNGGQQVAFDGMTDFATATAAQQQPSDMIVRPPNVAYSVPPSMGGTTEDYLPVGTDQMQLDGDIMQYFNDVAGFPEGGLTGLDDWMPADFTGFGQMPDISSWQATLDPNGGNPF